jgi:hypothetical protein
MAPPLPPVCGRILTRAAAALCTEASWLTVALAHTAVAADTLPADYNDATAATLVEGPDPTPPGAATGVGDGEGDVSGGGGGSLSDPSQPMHWAQDP